MAKRAVIYARYSSDKQREASIEDQARLCREYIERQGWDLTDVYADPDFSGKTSARPEYRRLLADADCRKFDVVVTEAVDRLSRRIAVASDLYDNLTQQRIELHTPAFGRLTDMHVAMMGMFAQTYSQELASKTRRGQIGRVEAGRVAGGNSYGYRALPAIKKGKATEAGEREIIPEQAEIVRRIFTEYAAGATPEAIAQGLNRDGIPGPRGGLWRNTSIRGHATRGTGILNNELYVGRYVWGRREYFLRHQTGRRNACFNEPDHIRVAEIPHLRIIDDELWMRVKERQASVRTVVEAAGGSLNAAHRARYVLSGLIKCGCCGGSYTVVGKDRYGCSNRGRGTGMCTNSTTVKRQTVEARVTEGLRQRLMAPERVAEYVRAVQAEAKAARMEQQAKADRLRRDLAEIRKAIVNLLSMIESGRAPASVLDRLAEREAERDRLEAELAAEPQETNVVELLPNIAGVYARKVAALADSLAAAQAGDEVFEQFRALITKVVLTPKADAENGLEMILHGALAEVLALGVGQAPKRQHPAAGATGCQVSVVAGAGFEPATFRL